MYSKMPTFALQVVVYTGEYCRKLIVIGRTGEQYPIKMISNDSWHSRRFFSHLYSDKAYLVQTRHVGNVYRFVAGQ